MRENKPKNIVTSPAYGCAGDPLREGWRMSEGQERRLIIIGMPEVMQIGARAVCD